MEGKKASIIFPVIVTGIIVFIVSFLVISFLNIGFRADSVFLCVEGIFHRLAARCRRGIFRHSAGASPFTRAFVVMLDGKGVSVSAQIFTSSGRKAVAPGTPRLFTRRKVRPVLRAAL